MKLLGRVVLTEKQGRELAEGAAIVIPREQLRRTTRRKPHGGDLIWVQEPYHEYLPKNQWTAQSVHGIVPGPRFGTPTPPHIAKRDHRSVYRDGKRLPRCLSRATLSVDVVTDEHIVGLVRMVQVDQLLAGDNPCG